MLKYDSLARPGIIVQIGGTYPHLTRASDSNHRCCTFSLFSTRNSTFGLRKIQSGFDRLQKVTGVSKTTIWLVHCLAETTMVGCRRIRNNDGWCRRLRNNDGWCRRLGNNDGWGTPLSYCMRLAIMTVRRLRREPPPQSITNTPAAANKKR